MQIIQWRLYFWPDKASAHYARKTTRFLESHNIHFVSKEDNPTEVPQCRPIEDFFGVLAQYVYSKNWVAKDVESLIRRISHCLTLIPSSLVQSTMEDTKRRLMRAYPVGIFERFQ